MPSILKIPTAPYLMSDAGAKAALPMMPKARALPMPAVKQAAKKPKANPYDADVASAKAQLTALETGKPADYQSAYQPQIDALLQSILNGESFDYDLDTDPLYKQYKSQYMALGNQAMRDTTGNAATLTAGYGNSYALAAGNQAYQAQLSGLNNVIPSLYASAMTAHQNRQAQKGDQLSVLNTQEGLAYRKYMDDAQAQQKELDYWYKKYRDDQALQKKGR